METKDIPQNIMTSEAVQILLAQGFPQNRIQKAIERLISDKEKQPEEITEQLINRELEEMRREGLDKLRRENSEMKAMLLCKSCEIWRVSCVNLGCNDAMCDACSSMAFCGKCGHPITEIINFSFTN